MARGTQSMVGVFEVASEFNARVTRLSVFEKTVRDVKAVLKHRPEQKKAFKKSAFGSLVGIDGSIWSNQLVHSLLLRLLKVDNQEDDAMYFDICGKRIRFGKEEFALITGLRFGKKEPSLAKVATAEVPSFFTKAFPNADFRKGVAQREVKNFFSSSIVAGTAGLDDDEVLSMCYLICMLEVNTRAPQVRVDARYIYLASNREMVDNFPWANDAFISTTTSARKGVVNAYNQPHDKNKTYSLGGFCVALQIFLAEVLSSLSTLGIVQKMAIGPQFPRMRRWRVLNNEISLKRIAQEGVYDSSSSEIVKPIVATEEEKNKDYFFF